MHRSTAIGEFARRFFIYSNLYDAKKTRKDFRLDKQTMADSIGTVRWSYN